MQFRIPASESEKQLVHEAVGELFSQLELCHEKAKHLVSVLEDNFLAMDKDYKMQLSKKSMEIDNCFWKIHTMMYSMKDNPERFVSQKTEDA